MEADKLHAISVAEDDDTLRGRYLTFRIGSEVYAFEIRYVTEIIGLQTITEIPNIKKYILGIINLRGIIVPVVDVRRRFSMPEIEYTDRSCIIVVRLKNNEIGLLVDEVAEVVVIKNETITGGPKTNKGTHSKFIDGMCKLGNEVKIILNMFKLLYDEDKLTNDNNNEN